MIRQELVDAIIKVESGGYDYAIGDRLLTFSAYGPMQIRWPVVLDVNRSYGTDYRARQCLGERELSIEIFQKYMSMYATASRLGHEPTDEDVARIWNGGPNGYKKTSTVIYWRKVLAALG